MYLFEKQIDMFLIYEKCQKNCERKIDMLNDILIALNLRVDLKMCAISLDKR